MVEDPLLIIHWNENSLINPMEAKHPHCNGKHLIESMGTFLFRTYSSTERPMHTQVAKSC
jgi:hypothetical protein